MSKESDIVKLLNKVEREACKNSFYEFIISFWDIICSEKIVLNWHIQTIADELQKASMFVIRREPVPYEILLNVSPGTSKSSILLYLYPVWLWCQDPTLRIVSSSYSRELSIVGSQKSRDIINSDKFKRLFPEIKLRRDSSAKGFYANTSGGLRYTTSSGGSVTGRHFDVLLKDDLLEASKANSEPEKIKVINHLQALSTREASKGKALHICIQQRLSETDVSRYIIDTTNPNKLFHINLPAVDDDTVRPLEWRKYYKDGLFDPIRLSKEVIEHQKLKLGTHGFSAQFLQNPIGLGGNLVKSDWFTTVTREYSNASVHTYNTFIDTGYKQQEKGKDPDPSGWITCYFENNTLYISDYQEVWESIMNLCRYLDKDLSKLHSRNSFLYVEPKASGVSIVQALRELSNLNVCEIKGRKESKLVELTAVLPLLESGRVVLVEGAWNDLFIKRLTEFPYGKHDEAVDVLCYALNHYIKNDTSKQEAKMKANIRRML